MTDRSPIGKDRSLVITITRPGDPVGWARTIPSATTGQRITAPRQRAVMAELRLEAQRQMRGRAPLERPIRIEVLAEFSIPESWSKKRQAAAAGMPVTKKPDADRILNLVKDALGAPRRARGKHLHPGIVYKDDATVSAALVLKRYARVAQTTIRIMADTVGGDIATFGRDASESSTEPADKRVNFPEQTPVRRTDGHPEAPARAALRVKRPGAATECDRAPATEFAQPARHRGAADGTSKRRR